MGRAYRSAVVEDSCDEHQHEDNTNPLTAQLMRPEGQNKRVSTRLCVCVRVCGRLLSPLHLYEESVQRGGQQKNDQLPHATQPQEHGTGYHGDHPAQQGVLFRVRTTDYPASSARTGDLAQGLTSGYMQMLTKGQVEVGGAGQGSLL